MSLKVCHFSLRIGVNAPATPARLIGRIQQRGRGRAGAQEIFEVHVSTKSPEISNRYLPPSHPSLSYLYDAPHKAESGVNTTRR